MVVTFILFYAGYSRHLVSTCLNHCDTAETLRLISFTSKMD